MATISSPGSGSGIDVAGLVQSIISAESEPALTRLERRASELQTTISAMGQLKSALSQFSSAVSHLGDGFQTRAANVSEVDRVRVASATASDAATSGDYSLEVTALANANKQITTGVADPDAAVGGGTLTVSDQSGNAFAIAVGATDSLSDIAAAINNADDNNIASAGVLTVDDGGGGSESKLVITATQTGSAGSIDLGVADDDGNNADTNGLSFITSTLSTVDAGVDAALLIDGQAVSSSTNTVTGVIDGVTLELEATNSGSPATLSITNNREDAEATVTNFVETFNGLRNAINALTNFDPSAGERGALLGDALTRGLESALRREIGGEFDGPIGSLAALGITTNPDGTLRIDTDTLRSAIDDGIDSVEALLSGDEGLASQLEAVIDDFLGPEGAFDAREDAIGARLDAIDEQREAIATRMASRETALFAQFNAMDALVAQLQATSNFLTQQFSAIDSLLSRAVNQENQS
ncbi:MAG: flagellar filament capping protein FliD [Pseudomonadota bacterium]